VTEIGNVPTSKRLFFGDIYIVGNVPVTKPEADPSLMLTNIPVSPMSPSIIEGNLKDWVFPKSRERSVKGGEKVGAPVLTLII
jgi:hypothetical protein